MCVRARVSHWKIVRMSSSVRCRKKLVLWPLPLHGFARWLLIDVVFFFCANNTPKSMKCSKAKVTSRHIVVAQRHLGLVSCLACFQVWGLFRSSFFCFIVACCAISSISASSVIRLIFSSCLSVVDRHQQTKNFFRQIFFCVILFSSAWVYLDIFLGILMDKLHEQKSALFEGSTSQRDRPKTCRKNRISFMNSHGNSEKNSTERLK